MRELKSKMRTAIRLRGELAQLVQQQQGKPDIVLTDDQPT